MAPLKFRAWHKTKKRMAHCGVWGRPWHGSCFSINISGRICDWSDPMADITDEVIVMQSTGLLDKNGKEIFEGDLVRLMDGELYEVVFLKESAAFELSGISNAEQHLLYIRMGMNPEVIGSIHESPELLTPKPNEG